MKGLTARTIHRLLRVQPRKALTRKASLRSGSAKLELLDEARPKEDALSTDDVRSPVQSFSRQGVSLGRSIVTNGGRSD